MIVILRRVLSIVAMFFLTGTACASSPSGSSATDIQRYRTLALVNARTGVVNQDFPDADCAIYATVADGKGGWYIGGCFTKVGDVARSGLAHLRSDGSLDLAFVPEVSTTSYVGTLAYHSKVLYVGNASSVAAFDGSTGARLWVRPTDSQVNSLAFGNGALYVGGGFGRIGGVSRTGIAALDPRTGKVRAWKVRLSLSSGLPVAVGPLALGYGAVYFSGDFDRVNGAKRHFGIAATSMRTGRPTTWSPKPGKGLNSRPDGAYSILVTHRQVLVGGEGGFVVYDARSARLLPWRENIRGSADKFTISGDIVFLGAGPLGRATSVYGGFDRAGGKRVNNLAAVRLHNGRFQGFLAWRPVLARCVDAYSIAASGNKVLVGGLFSAKNASPCFS